MGQRIERYGSWETTIGENIAFGNKNGREIVLQLMIDDGVSSRGHRKNIFSEAFKVVGIASHLHPTYKITSVFDYAGGMHP